MDFSKVDLTLFFFSILPGLITGALGFAASYLALRRQIQQIAIQPKLDEADLAIKVEALYAKLDAVREKEIESLRHTNADLQGNIELLRKSLADVRSQLADEREQHACDIELLKEEHALKINSLQLRIDGLEAEIVKLKDGAIEA